MTEGNDELSDDRIELHETEIVRSSTSEGVEETDQKTIRGDAFLHDSE